MSGEDKQINLDEKQALNTAFRAVLPALKYRHYIPAKNAPTLHACSKATLEEKDKPQMQRRVFGEWRHQSTKVCKQKETKSPVWTSQLSDGRL